MNMDKVVTRIAPSPTGLMHIGTVRTALFNYLFAKKHGGTYLVRVEDTDKERYQEDWVDAIWNDFAWLGLTPDLRYVQSEHVSRHRELLHTLVEEGKAYVSKEAAKDGSGREVAVVRLKNAGKELTFTDVVRGDITFDTTELGDFVIARSIDDPLYHFAVVVDDADAGVTHVIRGDDHISNTPRQILIQEALGFPRPVYVHLPLILAPDRSKLSKRKHGASVENYKSQGILPEALLNYLALLGWNPGTDQEIFSMDQLIGAFDLTKIQKSGAVFDIEKLKWFNREYLKQAPDSVFETALQSATGAKLPERVRKNLITLARERSATLSDIDADVRAGEYAFAFEAPGPDPEMLKWKKDTDPKAVLPRFMKIAEILKATADSENPEDIKQALWSYAEEAGKGEVLWPLRVALTGRERSPDPFTLIATIGIPEALARIETARAKIEG
jgi:glutamyl-tRNA synthetase